MKHIVIATNGFVYIGDLVSDGRYVRLEDAHNIRRWGTSSGLGELALNGPTPNTVLDAVGVVEIAFHAVIAKIPCSYDS